MMEKGRKIRIPEWLRPDQDSLTLRMTAHGGKWWMSVFNLIWSFWLFLPLFLDEPKPALYWSIGLSYPVFLACFGLIQMRPMREARQYVFVLAMLACVNMPFNYAAWDYGVFACAYIPWVNLTRLKVTAARFAMVLVPMTAIAIALRWPWAQILIMLGVCVGVGMGCLAGATSVSRHRSEEMSRDEVRRLAAGAERERIGRDLHDLLGHTLSLITLKLELSRKLFDADPVRARRELGEAEDVARNALAEVRSAVTGIRATGLAGELASARLMLKTSGVALAAGDLPVLPHDIDSALAMVVREASTNIHRHARARRATMDVEVRGGEVLLWIRDDGHGGARVAGNGLQGVRERVQSLSGSLRVHSPAGQGTELHARIPLSPSEATGTALDDARARNVALGNVSRPLEGRA